MAFNPAELSRRERQIMDIVFSKHEASATEILEAMHDPPSNSAVRTHLRILEDKGYLKHRQEGLRFVYSPIEARETARRSAIKRLVHTFFEGSLTNAVAALVDVGSGKISAEEMNRLEAIIQSAKQKNK